MASDEGLDFALLSASSCFLGAVTMLGRRGIYTWKSCLYRCLTQKHAGTGVTKQEALRPLMGDEDLQQRN